MVIAKTNEYSRWCGFVNDSAEKLSKLLSKDASSRSVERSGQSCCVSRPLYSPYCGRLGSHFA